MLGNYYPIIAAISANIFAQIVKVPLHFLLHREWKMDLIKSTGGMPSSHSATVSALSTAIALKDGLDSSTFAIALVLTGVVAYDAMGIRRHAGTHAEAINNIVEDVKYLSNLITNPKTKNVEITEEEDELKELLGHQPIEVFFGLVTGIIVGVVLYNLM